VPDTICSVSSCTRASYARGMCQAHYRRQRKHGDVCEDTPVRVQRSDCSIEGCDSPHYEYGFCIKHAARWRRHGDPHATLRIGYNQSIEAKFRLWMPDAPPTHGCWLWRGRSGSHGYGVISRGNRHIRASRVSYELFNGPIPDGLVIRHTCDNPPCVHPRHLITGTGADNTRDMVERDRHHRGTRQPNTHLSDEDVRTMRELYSAGETQRQIAERFDVSRSTVGLIVTRKTWKHVA
jgi:hypothetical protein